jgi:hypothetical protein
MVDKDLCGIKKGKKGEGERGNSGWRNIERSCKSSQMKKSKNG